MHAGDCAGDAYCLESAPQWFEFRRVAFHRGHIVFFGQANSTIVRDIEPQAYKSVTAGGVARRPAALIDQRNRPGTEPS